MSATIRMGSALFLGTFAVFHAAAASAQVPITLVPPGYANYCSVIYGGGSWNFELGQTSNSDPCADILKPGARITRAGLWQRTAGVRGMQVEGENNVLIRCDPLPGKTLPQLFPDRGQGAQFINKFVGARKGLKNCIVTVAPVALPVFSRPYGTTPGQSTPDADVDKIFVSGFNFDSVFDPWDVAGFGQDLSKAGKTAISFDRFGRQQQRRGADAECVAAMQQPGCSFPSRAGSNAECVTRGQPPGCIYTQTFEPAYDWTMPQGKPLVAVADGKVLWAGTRDVSSNGCDISSPSCKSDPTIGCKYSDPKQKEIYVEHQVGNDKYAERFVTIYYHLDKFVTVSGGKTDTPLAPGTLVAPGETIGVVGSTGCSGGAHLDFRVVRLTNLSGGRAFNFQVQLPTNPIIPGIPGAPCVGAIVCQTPSQEGYGSNGLAGHIDPFGWAAPKGKDPWAWKSIGKTAGVFPSGVTDFGAFSINLWRPGQAPPTYWTDFVPVYAQGAPGNGIGGYNLQDSVDRVFAFDYDGSGKLDHLVLYRPGTGTIWILKNKNGVFTPVYQQGAPGNGIGGYDLQDSVDRVFAFDYDGSGKLDHLVLYRPGTGTIWILKNTNGAFTPVYAQGAPGNGIGGYNLQDSVDRVFAFDYDGSGKLDHLVLYRPGTGTIWILKNKNGVFTPVYQQGAPGNGIGGYNLQDAVDRVFAFDYDGSGKLDHLVLYRAGTGTIWILKNTNGAFTPVYAQGAPGNGIGGYDLLNAGDQVFAFDYAGSGKLDHLALYRPGTGTIWILRNNNDTTFDWVYRQGDPGNGIGGYNLKDSVDQVFAFDYAGSGKLDHLVLYRPGTGTIWILKRENSG